MLRIQVRVKNEKLIAYREDEEINQREMAERCGVRFKIYVEMENLKHYPVKLLTDGTSIFSDDSENVAAVVGVPVEVLFPEALKFIQNSSFEKTVSPHQLSGMTQAQLLLPDENVEQAELQKTVQDVLQRFSPRTRRIVELRYGLAGSPAMTLSEISEQTGVSRERAGQILNKFEGKCRSSPKMVDKFIGVVDSANIESRGSVAQRRRFAEEARIKKEQENQAQQKRIAAHMNSKFYKDMEAIH